MSTEIYFQKYFYFNLLKQVKQFWIQPIQFSISIDFAYI